MVFVKIFFYMVEFIWFRSWVGNFLMLFVNEIEKCNVLLICDLEKKK